LGCIGTKYKKINNETYTNISTVDLNCFTNTIIIKLNPFCHSHLWAFEIKINYKLH